VNSIGMGLGASAAAAAPAGNSVAGMSGDTAGGRLGIVCVGSKNEKKLCESECLCCLKVLAGDKNTQQKIRRSSGTHVMAAALAAPLRRLHLIGRSSR
jgi:nicotinamide mononucleotide (NMN) deamidase PncC